jgi:hypothetical protein
MAAFGHSRTSLKSEVSDRPRAGPGLPPRRCVRMGSVAPGAPQRRPGGTPASPRGHPSVAPGAPQRHPGGTPTVTPWHLVGGLKRAEGRLSEKYPLLVLPISLKVADPAGAYDGRRFPRSRDDGQNDDEILGRGMSCRRSDPAPGVGRKTRRSHAQWPSLGPRRPPRPGRAHGAFVARSRRPIRPVGLMAHGRSPGPTWPGPTETGSRRVNDVIPTRRRLTEIARRVVI